MPVTAQNSIVAGARPAVSDPACDGDQFAATTAVTLATQSRSLWINTAGDVFVDFVGGIDGKTASLNVKFSALASQLLPIRVTKIYATTTATGVILY